MAKELRLGIDVGGTFTDVILLMPDGTALAKKVLSTPPDFSVAVRRGVEELLSEHGLSGSQVREYSHGATVATNAIITRTGALTALVTSKGFRDVLEIRRLRVHKLYQLRWDKPEPLVPRHLRLEVPARMRPSGAEDEALDEEVGRRIARQLVDEGVESVAVCFLHSYSNGSHEQRMRELIRELAPGVQISLSFEILPEIKEYERTSTTVINAYVQPVVSHYFASMEQDLRDMGIDVPIMVMQSNGGMMPSEVARERAVHIIESGPAAGVTGGYHLSRRMGLRDVMTLDMGGTTAKGALIEDGEVSRSPEYEVGGEVSIGHRLMKGSGYLIRVPSIDLAEVGAGGGSVAWADELGVVKVGPRSAGANPGPACYGLGGEDPTITDADVCLGFTNPEYLAGGSLKIHPHLAEKVIHDGLAKRLGMDTVAVAWAIRMVANSNLIRALRAVSTERGRDPRRFSLFAFGGMGPVHAVDLAEELGIRKVLVPPLPGLFSALGLLFADVEHHLIRTHYANTSDLDMGRANDVLGELEGDALSTLEREGYRGRFQSTQLFADTRYAGQDYALTIPLTSHRFDRESVGNLVESFHVEHGKTYGYRSDKEEVQVVGFRCLARGLSETPRVPPTLRFDPEQPQESMPLPNHRKAYWGPKYGWIEVPVLSRLDLTSVPVMGPILIEESNSATVVSPNWNATIDDWSNIVLEAQ